MASIEERGARFRVRWWNAAGRQRTHSCGSRAAADAVRRAVEQARAQGRDWHPQGAGRAPLLREVMVAFIEHRALRLRRRTLVRYAENLDLLLRYLGGPGDAGAAAGALPVTVLGRPVLDDFYAWLRRPESGLHGRERGPDTSRKIVEVVQLLWRWAEASDRWPGLVPAPRQIEMTRSALLPVLAPTWLEMDACVAAARGFHHRLAVFLRYTGLRIAEVALLERRDFNAATGTLTIRREVNRPAPVASFRSRRTFSARWRRGPSRTGTSFPAASAMGSGIVRPARRTWPGPGPELA
jgi:hypothetical protein